MVQLRQCEHVEIFVMKVEFVVGVKLCVCVFFTVDMLCTFDTIVLCQLYIQAIHNT